MCWWLLGEGESALCEGMVPGSFSVLPQMVLAALLGLSKLWGGEDSEVWGKYDPGTLYSSMKLLKNKQNI